MAAKKAVAPPPKPPATAEEVAQADKDSLHEANRAAALNAAMLKAIDLAGLRPLVRDQDSLEVGFGFRYARPSNYPPGEDLMGTMPQLHLVIDVAGERVMLKLENSARLGKPAASVNSSGTTRTPEEALLLSDLLHKGAVAGAAWVPLCQQAESRFPPHGDAP